MRLKLYYSETGEYRYYLDTDEIFLYVNRDTSSYTILGSGSMIKFIKGTVETDELYTLTCEAISLDKLKSMTESDLLKKFEAPSGGTLIAAEQTLYNLVEGDTLSITLDSEWERSNVIYDDGRGDENRALKPIFYSYADTLVKHFTASYLPKDGGSDPIAIPSLDLSDGLWIARASLILDVSQTKEQEVVQYIPWNQRTGDKGTALQNILRGAEIYPKIIDESDFTDFTEIQKIQMSSSFPWNNAGGNNLQVSYTYLNEEEPDPTDFNIYQLRVLTGNAKINTVNNEVQISEPSYTFTDVRLQCNTKYILGLRATSSLIESLTAESLSEDLTLTPLFNNITYSPENGYAATYYKVEVNSASGSETYKEFDITITASYTSTPESDAFIYVEPLYQYDERNSDNSFETLYGLSDSDILGEVQRLDYESRFAYNYKVDTAEEIVDPLKASSFFDINHVYNKYTIGKAELRTDGSTDASIQFVNNK